MSDYLIDLGQNRIAKSLVRRLSLPIRLPEPLRRNEKPWTANPFVNLKITVSSLTSPSPIAAAVRSIAKAGQASLASGKTAEVGVDALVLDCTGLSHVEGLAKIFEFLRLHLPQLQTNGRVILIGLDPEATRDLQQAAAQAALSGLIKSLAKEIGRNGSTAQVLTLDAGLSSDPEAAKHALCGPLTFLLSSRGAFVSGQVLTLSKQIAPPAQWQWPETQILAGKRALVTGAAQGIGYAIARRLAEEGAEVLGIDHPSQAENLQAAMARLATPGQTLSIDLARPDAAREIATWLKKSWGGIDILINNAGVTRDKTLKRMQRSDWDLTLATNLSATLELTEALIDSDGALIQLMQPEGRIICMSSISGLAGNAGQTNYAAAKSGIVGMVRLLAPRLANRGITINAIAPGFIDTRMTRAMPLAMREVARRFNALSQAGQPEDVAEAALMFASPSGYSLSGTTLRVCGLNLIGA